jgi:hypothetical protein
MTRTVVRSILVATLTAMVLAGVPAGAWAGIIPTATVIASEPAPERAANLALVQAQLARADVQQQLQALGVNPLEASQRAASLTDMELARLAQRMQQAPAGGDGGILALVGVVFLVLLLLDYLEVIHVFRTHK